MAAKSPAWEIWSREFEAYAIPATIALQAENATCHGAFAMLDISCTSSIGRKAAPPEFHRKMD